MKRYALGDASMLAKLEWSEAERDAWLHPKTYHSFHVERMAQDIYMFRDSQEAAFYICSADELARELVERLKCRKVDPDWQSNASAISLLSREEIDDLLSEL